MPFSFSFRRLLVGVAARLDTVEFITYRTHLAGAVDCGARTPPDRIYLTYRASSGGQTGSDGQIAAVEFLPR